MAAETLRQILNIICERSGTDVFTAIKMVTKIKKIMRYDSFMDAAIFVRDALWHPGYNW